MIMFKIFLLVLKTEALSDGGSDLPRVLGILVEAQAVTARSQTGGPCIATIRH